MTIGIIQESCDYVTVVTMDSPTGKLYEIIDGELVKTPAANNASGWGQTRYVPTADALSALLIEISTRIDCALILGFIAGTEDGVAYRLMSASKFEEFTTKAGVKVDKFASKPVRVGEYWYATRTKRMFHASSWFGFDRDVVEGMPEELEPDATFPRWWEMMNTMIPEIRGCSYVAVKSASCRVMRNGVPMANTNIHVYMQAKEAADTERFGKAGMVHSFARGYGFMRPVKDRTTGETIGQRPWTLYDPTTFSRERLFFDGSPILNPEDPSVMSGELTIEPSRPIVFNGMYTKVNTRSLALPSKDEQRAWGLELEVDNKGRVTIINPRDLTPDISFEYHNRATGERGVMTMEEFVAGDVDRLSCQSVFRPDSVSMAAYVSKEDDCEPFMYDVGTNINYKYNPAHSLFADAMANGTIDTGIKPNGSANNTKHTTNNSTITFDLVPNINDFEMALSRDVQTNVPLPPITIDLQADPMDIKIPTPPTALPGDNNGIPVPPKPTEEFVAPDLSHLDVLPNDVSNEGYETVAVGNSFSLAISGSLHGLAPEFSETDLANAQRFANMFDGEFKFVPIYKSWFRWRGHRWEKCDDGDARSAAHLMVSEMAKTANSLRDDSSFRKWAKASCSSPAIGALLREACNVPSMIVSVKQIDNNWYNFGVGNGYVDLRLATVDLHALIGGDVPAGVLHATSDTNLIGFKEPDRNLFITKGSDVDYVAGAQCPEWNAALWEIFSKDQELIDFFQIFVGYSMCGDPVHEVMAFLVGNGSNGKSTITGILERVFGDYKATVDKAVLMTKRDGNGQTATPALARLKGIRLAVVTETKEGDTIDESVVKALSGSDTITARHLHGDPFDFEATFVSWIATNHAPNIRSVDEGTWRRILYFPFKRNFLKEKGRKGIDTGLKGRIIDNELSGVLNWCLEGVLKYRTEGLIPPPSVLAASQQYREEQDIVADWFNSCIEEADDHEVTYGQLWQSYTNYSSSRGDDLIRQSRTLNAKISARGFERVDHVKGFNRERGFKGLRISIAIPDEK